MYTLILGGICVGFSCDAKSQDERVLFTIKPALCVLADGEEVCQDTLELRWRSKASLDLCLYQSGVEDPIACWEQEQAGVHRKEIRTGGNLQFQLRHLSDKELIAKQEFQVLQNQVKYRHRRRNAWSFF